VSTPIGVEINKNYCTVSIIINLFILSLFPLQNPCRTIKNSEYNKIVKNMILLFLASALSILDLFGLVLISF
jgi:hypothetical protein